MNPQWNTLLPFAALTLLLGAVAAADGAAQVSQGQYLATAGDCVACRLC